jgi:hypothetical protein
MKVRINRLMMNERKYKTFSWIRGGYNQVDKGGGMGIHHTPVQYPSLVRNP